MNDVKILGRSDFLAVTANRKRELVPVPELGGSVYIGELFTGQVVEFNERIRAMKDNGKDVSPATSIELMALLVSMTACDEHGEQLFTEADVMNLTKANVSTLMTLSVKAVEVSGMNNAAIEEVKGQLKKALSADSLTI
jgi:hypothetical protein